MKTKLPSSVYNWLSIIGAVVALISLFMIIFLFAISTIFDQGGSYLGLIIYIILPGFLVIGLLLIPIGMYIYSKKKKKGGETKKPAWPVVDLNIKAHRNAFTIFAIGSTIFLFLSAIGSYEAFHYTESVEFCGTLCHEVMKPEYTAYQFSSHARVACVECHVGSGADWYVRSKLSGLYQVYAVTTGVFPRPIPTPIHNLRPARETCEKCHWPQKFYSHQLVKERHYLSDEKNTEWNIDLVLKVGASHSALGLSEGIHWHINPDTKIEYIASDEKRQTIPWVKFTDLKTGKVKIFKDEDNMFDESKLDSLETHTMDCMDCHTRPSHNYRPPAFFVNNAMTAGDIPKELPGIKSLAMDICSEEFATTKEAMDYIRSEIESNYAEQDSIDSKLVEQAVTGLQKYYSRNIFPEMKVRWDAYPNNIGHMEFTGCFRCHNDTHQTEDGEVISKNCNLCHSITAQGSPGNMMAAGFDESLEFKHPVDIDEEWKEMLCVDCHTGLNP